MCVLVCVGVCVCVYVCVRVCVHTIVFLYIINTKLPYTSATVSGTVTLITHIRTQFFAVEISSSRGRTSLLPPLLLLQVAHYQWEL